MNELADKMKNHSKQLKESLQKKHSLDLKHTIEEHTSKFQTLMEHTLRNTKQEMAEIHGKKIIAITTQLNEDHRKAFAIHSDQHRVALKKIHSSSLISLKDLRVKILGKGSSHSERYLKL